MQLNHGKQHHINKKHSWANFPQIKHLSTPEEDLKIKDLKRLLG